MNTMERIVEHQQEVFEIVGALLKTRSELDVAESEEQVKWLMLLEQDRLMELGDAVMVVAGLRAEMGLNLFQSLPDLKVDGWCDDCGAPLEDPGHSYCVACEAGRRNV